jgi:hypothetical protein
VFDEQMKGDKQGTLYAGFQLIDDDKIAEALFQYIEEFIEKMRRFNVHSKVTKLVLNTPTF